MAQRVKVPFLETSHETFQHPDGSGSYNTGCPTPTGNRLPALVRPKSDSLSPTESQSNSQLEDTLEVHQRILQGSGACGETECDLLTYWRRNVKKGWNSGS